MFGIVVMVGTEARARYTCCHVLHVKNVRGERYSPQREESKTWYWEHWENSRGEM